MERPPTTSFNTAGFSYTWGGLDPNPPNHQHGVGGESTPSTAVHVRRQVEPQPPWSGLWRRVGSGPARRGSPCSLGPCCGQARARYWVGGLAHPPGNCFQTGQRARREETGMGPRRRVPEAEGKKLAFSDPQRHDNPQKSNSICTLMIRRQKTMLPF